MPPLFYIVTLAIMLTRAYGHDFLMLAWSYFTFRVGHGLVHLTINKVPRASCSSYSAMSYCLRCG